MHKWTGYESPCGVMRLILGGSNLSPVMLRIPMWGYESNLIVPERESVMLRIPMWGYEQLPTRSPPNILLVTNPHVGL